jgi:hypothetical protein
MITHGPVDQNETTHVLILLISTGSSNGQAQATFASDGFGVRMRLRRYRCEITSASQV